MATNFKVVIKNCSATELPAKDSNGYSDPYLSFNFDNYKVFKTDYVKKSLNPTWTNFSKEFFYETKYADRLDKKKLVIECYDKDFMSADDFIGFCVVDLHTLANGPVRHSLSLKDGNKAAGTVKFDVEMHAYATVAAYMRDLRIVSPEVSKDLKLEYSYSMIDTQKKRQYGSTPKPKHVTANEAFFETSPFNIQSTFHDLMVEGLMIEVKAKKDDHRLAGAKASIKLGQYLTSAEVKNVPFKELMLHPKSNKPVAEIQGLLTLENLPKFAQLVGGEHTEAGCTGKLLLPFLNPPSAYLVKVASKPQAQHDPFVMPQRPQSHYADSSFPHQQQNDNPQQQFMQSPQRNPSLQHQNYQQQQGYPQGPPQTNYAQVPGARQQPPVNYNPADNDYFYMYYGRPDTHDAASDEYGALPPVGTYSKRNLHDGVVRSASAGAAQEKIGLRQHPGAPPHSAPATPPMPSIGVIGRAHSTPVGDHQRSFSDSSESLKPKKAKKASRSPSPNPDSLPPGWEAKLDPNSGKTFYVDHVNKKTQWTHPAIGEKKEKKDKEKKKEKEKNHKSSSLTPDEVRGRPRPASNPIYSSTLGPVPTQARTQPQLNIPAGLSANNANYASTMNLSPSPRGDQQPVRAQSVPPPAESDIPVKKSSLYDSNRLNKYAF